MNKPNLSSKLKSILSSNNISVKALEEEKNKLSKKFGKETSYNDAMWGLFNKLVLKHINDFQKLNMNYYEMATFLNKEGKNPHDMLFQSKKMELIHYRKAGINKVQVIVARKVSCKECWELNGKIYSIEEALKKMPIPNKKCKFHLHRGKFPFCRCTWGPDID